MELVNHIAEDYARQFSSPVDELLQEIENNTLQYHPHAQMLSGRLQGKFLEMISCMIKPHRILEIGTFTGYSALCLAKGLQLNGKLHTIEIREEDALTAKKYFAKSNVFEKIELHLGNAKQIIPLINEQWDLVFIDADKTGYIDYYELTLPSVKAGGFILADNVLFHGEVLQTELNGKNAKAIHAFNEYVTKDIRVENVMLTVRDGLQLMKKL
jgi:predicted O-methyltransferase YrrM